MTKYKVTGKIVHTNVDGEITSKEIDTQVSRLSDALKGLECFFFPVSRAVGTSTEYYIENQKMIMESWRRNPNDVFDCYTHDTELVLSVNGSPINESLSNKVLQYFRNHWMK